MLIKRLLFLFLFPAVLSSFGGDGSGSIGGRSSSSSPTWSSNQPTLRPEPKFSKKLAASAEDSSGRRQLRCTTADRPSELLRAVRGLEQRAGILRFSELIGDPSHSDPANTAIGGPAR